MSLAYVQQREFFMSNLGEENSVVQFADGSTSNLVGKVEINIVLGTKAGPSFVITFFVLNDLSCDILFGEEFLDETEAFDTYCDAFPEEHGPTDVKTIVWFNLAEWKLSRLVRDQSATDREAGTFLGLMSHEELPYPWLSFPSASGSKYLIFCIYKWFQGRRNGLSGKKTRKKGNDYSGQDITWP